jgi:hypothetical protein
VSDSKLDQLGLSGESLSTLPLTLPGETSPETLTFQLPAGAGIGNPYLLSVGEQPVTFYLNYSVPALQVSRFVKETGKIELVGNDFGSEGILTFASLVVDASLVDWTDQTILFTASSIEVPMHLIPAL